MADFIDIDIQGVAELSAAWERAPGIVETEFFRASTEATLLLERETRERTPRGVGGGAGLSGSFSARPPRAAGDIVVAEMGTALDYAAPVELGTRPHFPPVAPIEDWVRHKLDVPAEDAAGVAYLIARKISRTGTEGAFMVRDAFAANRAQVARIFEAAQSRIRDALGRT